MSEDRDHPPTVTDTASADGAREAAPPPGGETPFPGSIERGGRAAAHLLGVMARLRHPEAGCPWDLEQDHRSIRPYLLEETYEVLEAIDREHDVDFEEELGDLLLQIVFHSRMAEERGAFDFPRVAEGIAAKLEERHPHIFGDTEVSSSREVLQNWEEIKVRKKKRESKLDGVPDAMPALTRAARIQEKAASVGFDWDRAEDVAGKMAEEADEFARAWREGPQRAEEELGDLLFSLVNGARKLGLDPEAALRGATGRFEGRFRRMEKLTQAPLKGQELAALDALWDRAKADEAGEPGE